MDWTTLEISNSINGKYVLPCEVKVAQLCRTLQFNELQPVPLLCPWNSPGKSTGVGCHFLLQGIFPTQGIEPRSPALQADALPSEPPGKPGTTKGHDKESNLVWSQEWMVVPFTKTGKCKKI